MRRRSLPPLLRCLWSGRSSTWRCAMSLWRQVAHAPDRETAKPLPTLGGVEAGNDNAPSADRILCRGRAGEAVAAATRVRLGWCQPTEREEAAAVGGPATSQDGVWIRLASSRSSRRTWPAHGLVCQFGLAGRVSAGRRARCCHAEGAPVGGHWAQLRRDPRPLRHRAGERDPKRRSGTSRAARAGGGGWPPTGCAAPALPCQVADSRTQDCEAAHHVSWRRAA
jgi:hypothetical protein